MHIGGDAPDRFRRQRPRQRHAMPYGQIVDRLDTPARVDMGEKSRGPVPAQRQLGTLKRRVVDQPAANTPSIEQREDPKPTIDRAPGIGPAGVAARVLEHVIPISRDLTRPDFIPCPAVRSSVCHQS